jgi:hypothetical protein
MDCTWIFLCNGLNIHSALFAIYDAKTLVFAIMQESKVDLAININTFMHKNRFDRETSSCSLMRD